MNITTPINAVLVDDEPNLLAHLQRLLSRLWPELMIKGTADNGQQALDLIAELQPDLVFLDIRMPVMDGIAVATALAREPDRMPLIVFTTAYDEYAVAAFDTAAIDYLLKPITEQRLAQCVERVQRQLRTTSGDTAATLKAVLAELQLAPQPGYAPNYLQWLRAGQGDTTELVAVDEVVYFKAEHKYTSAFTEQREHVLRLSLKELAEQLDPQRFWQVHRGLLVNVADIVDAKRDLRGRYALSLKRRKETLRTSQAYGHLFKHM